MADFERRKAGSADPETVHRMIAEDRASSIAYNKKPLYQNQTPATPAPRASLSVFDAAKVIGTRGKQIDAGAEGNDSRRRMLASALRN